MYCINESYFWERFDTLYLKGYSFFQAIHFLFNFFFQIRIKDPCEIVLQYPSFCPKSRFLVESSPFLGVYRVSYFATTGGWLVVQVQL